MKNLGTEDGAGEQPGRLGEPSLPRSRLFPSLSQLFFALVGAELARTGIENGRSKLRPYIDQMPKNGKNTARMARGAVQTAI